jgi:hypothetical protein
MLWRAWPMTGRRTGRLASTCSALTCNCHTSPTPAKTPPNHNNSLSKPAKKSATPSSASSPLTSGKTLGRLGTVNFDYAWFSGGTVNFGESRFSGGTVNFRRAEFCGGTVFFGYSEFTNGTVKFGEAEFSGGTVIFDLAVFSGAWVYFTYAKFSGGEVDFNGARFSRGTVDFGAAEFSGGTVDFSQVADWSVPPSFPRTDTPLPGLKLPGAPRP